MRMAESPAWSLTSWWATVRLKGATALGIARTGSARVGCTTTNPTIGCTVSTSPPRSPQTPIAPSRQARSSMRGPRRPSLAIPSRERLLRGPDRTRWGLFGPEMFKRPTTPLFPEGARGGLPDVRVTGRIRQLRHVRRLPEVRVRFVPTGLRLGAGGFPPGEPSGRPADLFRELLQPMGVGACAAGIRPRGVGPVLVSPGDPARTRLRDPRGRGRRCAPTEPPALPRGAPCRGGAVRGGREDLRETQDVEGGGRDPSSVSEGRHDPGPRRRQSSHRPDAPGRARDDVLVPRVPQPDCDFRDDVPELPPDLRVLRVRDPDDGPCGVPHPGRGLPVVARPGRQCFRGTGERNISSIFTMSRAGSGCNAFL